MTYIALPETHDPKTGEAVSYAVMKHENGQNVPVTLLRQHDCPLPIQKLAENLASILNGNKPLHRLESDHKIYYEEMSEGFQLRFLKEETKN